MCKVALIFILYIPCPEGLIEWKSKEKATKGCQALQTKLCGRY